MREDQGFFNRMIDLSILKVAVVGAVVEGTNAVRCSKARFL